MSIYVLALEHGKYYVGYSEDVETRINQHKAGNGSEWTKLHHPIKTICVVKAGDENHERNMTLKYMEKCGVENVRGAGYSQCVLPESTKKAIEAILAERDKQCEADDDNEESSDSDDESDDDDI